MDEVAVVVIAGNGKPISSSVPMFSLKVASFTAAAGIVEEGGVRARMFGVTVVSAVGTDLIGTGVLGVGKVDNPACKG